MVVIGVLLGGLVVPLATEQDASKRRETNRLLLEVHNSLLGFAASNGRLPCPATAASAGLAAPSTATTACTSWHGFVPARTLGLSGPTDANNRLLDRWRNPVRYSLSSVSSGAYANAISLSLTPDFQICPSSACTTPIADNVVAVIFSLGADGCSTTSADQLENTDGDLRFVDRTFSEAAGAEFDDEMIWISPNSLTYHLVSAGQLN